MFLPLKLQPDLLPTNVVTSCLLASQPLLNSLCVPIKPPDCGGRVHVCRAPSLGKHSLQWTEGLGMANANTLVIKGKTCAQTNAALICLGKRKKGCNEIVRDLNEPPVKRDKSY